jgi:hypothetical protein
VGRLDGAAAERVQPRAERADDRVAREQLVVVEARQPRLDRGDPPRPVVGLRQRGDEPGHPVHVAGGGRVVDRLVVPALRLAPLRSAQAERRHGGGVAAAELAAQHVAEEVVVPVPLAAVVERHEEEVGLLDRLEHPGRVRAPEHGVAERRAELVEHGGAGEELDLAGRGLAELLGAQVVGDEAVVAAEGGHTRGRARAVLQGQRGQVEADGPALGALVQVRRLALGQLDARGADEHLRLRRRERELVGAELHEAAVGAEPRHRQPRRGTARQDELRAVRQVSAEREDRVDAVV